MYKTLEVEFIISRKMLILTRNNLKKKINDDINQHMHVVYLCYPKTPAPRRGEIVRQIGQALRDNLENLGKLVSYMNYSELWFFFHFFTFISDSFFLVQIQLCHINNSTYPY